MREGEWEWRGRRGIRRDKGGQRRSERGMQEERKSGRWRDVIQLTERIHSAKCSACNLSSQTALFRLPNSQTPLYHN